VEYFPGMVALSEGAAPSLLDKSWTITADLDLPAGSESGMIITHGGITGGYGLYLRDGKPTFVYNYLGVERPTVAAKDALPKGKSQVVVDFKYDGGGLGKGGTVTMSAGGAKIAEGRVERTIPLVISLQEGLDVGMDNGSPVDFTYKPPFAFTGKIEKVTVDLK
jgi:hypothetical protein